MDFDWDDAKAESNERGTSMTTRWRPPWRGSRTTWRGERGPDQEGLETVRPSR